MNIESFEKSFSVLPYHNKEHAEDVMKAVSKIRNDKIYKIAAIGHDLLHTGTPLPGDEERASEKTIEIATRQ